MEISPEQIRLAALALAAPAIIVAICMIATGHERRLFMFGIILFAIVAIAVLVH